jgi:DNA uptake protein ComE-like DNA-binding protein
VVRRVAGAVVLIGMIYLGSVVGNWMIRVRPDAPDPSVLSRSDSLSAPTGVSAPAKTSLSRAPVVAPSSFLADPLVFLSHAPADSLDMLPGIGPVLAARIIEARRAHGGFASWKDVDTVKGIGPRMIERWKALSTRQ